MKKALNDENMRKITAFRAKFNEICADYMKISALTECLFQYMASDEISVSGSTYLNPPVVDGLGGIVDLMKALKIKLSECDNLFKK